MPKDINSYTPASVGVFVLNKFMALFLYLFALHKDDLAYAGLGTVLFMKIMRTFVEAVNVIFITSFLLKQNDFTL